MKKLSVPKLCYSISNAIFYSLCLSGLIWQSTMISISFFEYDVVSDIKVIMPENDTYERYLNFCYLISSVIVYPKYEKLLQKYEMNMSMKDERDYKRSFIISNLTFKEQFDVAMKDGIVDERHSSTRFLYKDFICHHIKSQNYRHFLRIKHLNQNISFITIMISKKLPNIDVNRLLAFSHEKNISSYVNIAPYSLYGQRLQAPYADQCMNFKALNFSGSKEAISSCLEEGKVSVLRIVSENENHLLKYRRKNISVYRDCKKYNRVECNSHDIFTLLVSKGSDQTKDNILRYHISIRLANQPSFRIVSKPKIGYVDLITYILGALGSWIGFSFININPIPFIMKIKDGANDWISKSKLTENDVRKIKRKIIRLEISGEKSELLRKRSEEKLLAMISDIQSKLNQE